MSDCLSHLVEMIVGSFPVQDPHLKQRQKGQIVDFHPIDHMKPFGPMDHVGPPAVVKEEVWEDVIPPTMVCSCRILPLLDDSVKGVLGNL